MVEIKWQDPPAALTLHDSIVAALKNNPGRWALVAENRSSSSAGTPWNKSGCETKVHRKNPGDGKPKYDVYARWPEKVLPLPQGKAQVPAAAPKAAGKTTVEKAVASGTALVPPTTPATKQGSTAPKPANDMGLQSFLEARRARGAVR